ncbi:MAG: NADAR family protein, partial [Proteobacteria bacterium]|nr:NADAR family protein [Pseudomonadota bacterium]
KRLTHLSDFPTRPDYSDAGRLTIMLELNRQKYSPRNPRLREQLLATGNAVLMEGNDWGDTFFGFDYNRGYGQNHLGRILMQVRAEIMEDIGAA